MANYVAPATPDLVVTRTPLRISFAGGGTDLPVFYERGYGAVFSTAINKYVYVTVKRHHELFFEPIRINYSKTEQVRAVDEIENNIVRECLRMLNIDPPLYVSTVADLPASTGLGGSSAFAVGLLHALHAYKGERVSAGQLAEEACHIEMGVLREPIGKQDQYAAAFGGLNFFRFNADGGVTVEPLTGAPGKLDALFENIMLLWTGLRRDASHVLSAQQANTENKLSELQTMRDHAHQLQALMGNGHSDPLQFGRVLDQSWQLKRGLATTISSDEIDTWYNRAMAAGAEGGKICGAGGGGFLLFIVSPPRQADVREALSDLLEVPVSYDVRGSQIILPFMP